MRFIVIKSAMLAALSMILASCVADGMTDTAGRSIKLDVQSKDIGDSDFYFPAPIIKDYISYNKKLVDNTHVEDVIKFWGNKYVFTERFKGYYTFLASREARRMTDKDVFINDLKKASSGLEINPSDIHQIGSPNTTNAGWFATYKYGSLDCIYGRVVTATGARATGGIGMGASGFDAVIILNYCTKRQQAALYEVIDFLKSPKLVKDREAYKTNVSSLLKESS